jgi:hypothetical protein
MAGGPCPVIREEERRRRTGGLGLEWNIFLNTEDAEGTEKRRSIFQKKERAAGGPIRISGAGAVGLGLGGEVSFGVTT